MVEQGGSCCEVAQADSLARQGDKVQDQHAQLDALLAAAGLGFLTERVAAQERPSIRFRLERVAPEDITLGATCIGGDPDVPADFEWPHAQGAALPFVAQVNLGEVATLGALPKLPPSGMLYFFFGEDAYFAGLGSGLRAWQVIYRRDTATLHRMPSPAPVPPRERYHPCRVHMAAELTLPPLDPYSPHTLARLGLNAPLTHEQNVAYWEAQQILSQVQHATHHLPIHRIGGWADEVQSEVEWECLEEVQAPMPLEVGIANSKENPWRLLLQMDTDGGPDTDWGDTGRIYFLIHEDHLTRHDFSNVWAILQCT